MWKMLLRETRHILHVQVHRKFEYAEHHADQCPGRFLTIFFGDGLRGESRLLRVDEPSRNLDNQVRQCREDHDLAVCSYLRLVTDASMKEGVHEATLGELLLLAILTFAALHVNAAAENPQEPRHCEEHDGTTCQSADTNSNIFLCNFCGTDARKEHHHAIWHSTQHGQNNTPDQAGHLWDKKQELGAVAEHVGCGEQDVPVCYENPEQHLRLHALRLGKDEVEHRVEDLSPSVL
mmetsp:Transcript_617/g.852  ORF Transcript_617/g.852 Transcript_617/m.852 type:complete len:235 (+) Transcript_617:1249-1953(+)